MASSRRYLSLLARICTAVGLLALIAASDGQATGVVRYVTDGDTFRLQSGERIRIANIDAPETHREQARCAAEVGLGLAAADRARGLLNHRRVDIVRVGRSYNRTVARVTLEGRDVGAMLVAMGAARPWLRGQAKPDWCTSAGTAPRRR